MKIVPKYYFFLITCSITFFINAAHAQQERPPMSLAQFTYLYLGAGEYDASTREPKAPVFGTQVPNPEQRIVYALKDSINRLLATELVQAMNTYWDLSLEASALQLEKSNPAFRDLPRFKPRAPKGTQGLQIFMRVTDKGPRPLSAYIPGEKKEELFTIPDGVDPAAIATRLQFECKVLDAADGKEVFSRSMEATLVRTDPPEGQYPLLRVPGMPASFVQSFGEAVRRFFSTGAPKEELFDVAPACLYVTDSLSQQIRQTIRFAYQGNQVKVVGGPELAWVPASKVDRERTGKKKRSGHMGIVDGILASSLNMDVSGEKKTSAEYMNRIRITDVLNDRQYIFHIPTMDTEVEQVVRSGSRTGSVETETLGYARNRLLTDDSSYLTAGADTLARFLFHEKSSGGPRDPFLWCWDGLDTTTLMPVPKQWSNQQAYPPLELEGFVYGKAFRISNFKAGNQLDMYYEDEHLATLRVQDGRPTDGILYQADVPLPVWQAMAAFTMIPFGYFGK